MPPYLLGGSFPLDIEAARAAIQRRIAEPLGLGLVEAARGILAIVDNHMVGAIRVVSVERGHDPRDFSLLPFGGAGPLHGGALARLLGMSTIVVPPGPGVLSALGLLVSNLKAEFTRTCLQKAGAFDAGAVARVFASSDRGPLPGSMPRRAGRGAQGRPLRQPALSASGLRLNVPWASHSETGGCEATVTPFTGCTRLYTFAQRIRRSRSSPSASTRAGCIHRRPCRSCRAPDPSRRAHRIASLVPGDGACRSRHLCARAARRRRRIPGPAILTQLDATTLLLPGQVGTVDRSGNLIVSEAS
jgi:N-methylhydantoinase A